MVIETIFNAFIDTVSLIVYYELENSSKTKHPVPKARLNVTYFVLKRTRRIVYVISTTFCCADSSITTVSRDYVPSVTNWIARDKQTVTTKQWSSTVHTC